MQTARFVIAVPLQRIGLIEAILLELACVLPEFGMALVESVGAIGEGAGIADAAPATAAEAGIAAAIEKASIAEARTTAPSMKSSVVESTAAKSAEPAAAESSESAVETAKAAEPSAERRRPLNADRYTHRHGGNCQQCAG